MGQQFQCKMLYDEVNGVSNTPVETVLVQKKLYWRMHTHIPSATFTPCPDCPRHLTTQAQGANTAAVYNSIWERYFVKKWSLLVGTVSLYSSSPPFPI